MAACECSPCGRTFTGLGPFDRHQDVDYSRHPAVLCKDPETAGLVRQASGRWGFPIDAGSRERLNALRAARASAGTTVTPRDPGAAESRSEPQVSPDA